MADTVIHFLGRDPATGGQTMIPLRATDNGDGTYSFAQVIEGVDAAPLAAGASKNAPVTVGTSDVTIDVPSGGPWNYLKVIVETIDRAVAVAVNEAAVLGTAGTPPDPSWGAGDVVYGIASELIPLQPALDTNDAIHLIASGAGTSVRLVFRA